ncbi:MAG: quinone-dependent dihydroorotate dehydrogenase [Lacibacter sp.]
MYQLLRFFFFLLDAERAHYLAMNTLRMLCSVPVFRKFISHEFTPATQPVTVWGLPFRNGVGLAAGFDKNACYLRELEALGFGFVEIGTVTPLPQAGNDKPRLFRLPKDEALINRMGFNNDGVEAVKRRLQRWQLQHPPTPQPRMIIGGNIGKNKVTPNEQAWKDYEICFNELYPYVDYFVVNVSSPNTPGLRELQEKEALRTILTHLQTLRSRQQVAKPILLKIAPDLTDAQLQDVADLALEIQLDGLVATNTTISRTALATDAAAVQRMGVGGLSGRPLRNRSTEVVRLLHRHTGGTLPIMGSGGIFTAADAREKLAAGATLVQVWTGFIYKGPCLVKHICNQL